jgi:predicted nucleic acid-binding protein
VIVLDANVLLEILEQRSYYDDVIVVLEKQAKRGSDFAVSTLTVSNTFYLAERHKIPTKRVEQLVESYKILSVLPDDVSWALAHYKGADFEDALQIAVSLREKSENFLTIDEQLTKKYSKFLAIELIGK